MISQRIFYIAIDLEQATTEQRTVPLQCLLIGRGLMLKKKTFCIDKF